LEELAATIFRIVKEEEVSRRVGCIIYGNSRVGGEVLFMEAAGSSKTLVTNYQSRWHHIPETYLCQ